jgi:hypothetical protein
MDPREYTDRRKAFVHCGGRSSRFDIGTRSWLRFFVVARVVFQPCAGTASIESTSSGVNWIGSALVF